MMIATSGQTGIAIGTGRGHSDFSRPNRDLLEALRSPLGAIWRHVTRSEVPKSPATARAFPSLTPAERQVARLIVTGRSNREIADLKSVSVKAVEQHLTHVYRKLDVTSRTQLIASVVADSGAS